MIFSLSILISFVSCFECLILLDNSEQIDRTTAGARFESALQCTSSAQPPIETSASISIVVQIVRSAKNLQRRNFGAEVWMLQISHGTLQPNRNSSSRLSCAETGPGCTFALGAFLAIFIKFLVDLLTTNGKLFIVVVDVVLGDDHAKDFSPRATLPALADARRSS